MAGVQTRRSRSAWRVAALATLVLSGCTSLKSYRFGPSPQSQDLIIEGEETAFARVQISSLGIAKDTDGALEMHFRFRLHNPGEEPFRVLPDAFDLVDGALHEFGPPHVAPRPPATDLEVGPGASALFDVAFPFPDGTGPRDLRLDGLSLEWGIEMSERDYTASIYFARLMRVYAYDPWYPPYVCYSGY